MLFRMNIKFNQIAIKSIFQSITIDRNDTNILKNKKNIRRSLRNISFLFSPINRNDSSEKVSLCISQNIKTKPYAKNRLISKKGSLTIETALALPVFFLSMVTVIHFMNLYKVQTEHLTNLSQSAKEDAMYAYNPRGGGLDEIVIPDVYSFKPLGALVPLPTIWCENTIRIHSWNGVESSCFSDLDTNEKMVYLAETGSVYHKNAACSYLNVSILQLSGSQVKTSKNKFGERYYACEICSRNLLPSGRVYVTEQGNRYHNNSACSGLKRTVMLVKESEVEGYSCCSRCQ